MNRADLILQQQRLNVKKKKKLNAKYVLTNKHDNTIFCCLIQTTVWYKTTTSYDNIEKQKKNQNIFPRSNMILNETINWIKQV